MSASDFIDVAQYLNALRKETQSQSILATKATRSEGHNLIVGTASDKYLYGNSGGCSLMYVSKMLNRVVMSNFT